MIVRNCCQTIRNIRFWVLAASFSFAACEKVDISEFVDSEPASPILPVALGKGTQERPYVVEQIMEDTVPPENCWVIGYVVGSTYRTMDGASFMSQSAYAGNVLLSSDSTCKDKAGCIPIELSTSAMQKAVNLLHNAKYHRQCVMVQGVPGRYFNVNGVRNIQSAYWLLDFDISDINSFPVPWEEVEFLY